MTLRALVLLVDKLAEDLAGEIGFTRWFERMMGWQSGRTGEKDNPRTVIGEDQRAIVTCSPDCYQSAVESGSFCTASAFAMIFATNSA